MLIRKEELLTQMVFNHSLMVATEGLLIAANMFDRLDGESNHAEWLKQDILRLGGTPSRCDCDAASIAGAQYYHIFHRDPRMLLGYMAALECNPAPLETVDALEELFGALPCLRHHAIHDIEHGELVRQEILAITDEDLQDDILKNYQWTLAAIRTVLSVRLSKLVPSLELEGVTHVERV
jgi:hypothetical protein